MRSCARLVPAPAPEIIDAVVTGGDMIRLARVLEEAGFDSEAVVAAAHIEEHGLHLRATVTGRLHDARTGQRVGGAPIGATALREPRRSPPLGWLRLPR